MVRHCPPVNWNAHGGHPSARLTASTPSRGLTWKQIKLADRHGQESELIDPGSIRAPIPASFLDAPKFLVLRYSGMLPMAGVRVDDVYHVLWIEPQFKSALESTAERQDP